LIVVVEDEPAMRGGLQVLLAGWGAQGESFESLAAATQWARECAGGVSRPQLLLVDYRLEGGRTGVEAINALREAFGRALPATAVTGSTISGIETETEQGDLHILIKPVVPGSLRAMIGFKLGGR